MIHRKCHKMDKWKKDIERQFWFFRISDPESKKDGLIIYSGQDIADLEDSLPDGLRRWLLQKANPEIGQTFPTHEKQRLCTFPAWELPTRRKWTVHKLHTWGARNGDHRRKWEFEGAQSSRIKSHASSPNRELTNLTKLSRNTNKIFEGIGKAQRDGQDIEIHLPMKENATPIAQKPWWVPYHLMEPLQKWIMTPSPGAHPLVVQPKTERNWPTSESASTSVSSTNPWREQDKFRHQSQKISSPHLKTVKSSINSTRIMAIISSPSTKNPEN